MKYAQNILDLIGNTPLVKLNKLAKAEPLILAKLEYFNPGGSVKDRIGIVLLEHAEKEGKIKPGATIVEPTSGNTGVGLALACAIKGYKLICVMPDKVSKEKSQLLEAYGARCVICPTAVHPDDERSYYKVAARITKETPNAYMPHQYFNPANPLAHYLSTGPEIWEQADHKITHFVAGMGTGGTICGTAKFLKEKNPHIKIIGVDTVGSVYKDYFYKKIMIEPHTYLIDGIGEDLIPSIIDFNLIDDIFQVEDKTAYEMTMQLARQEAILAGNSSGAAVHVALKIASSAPLDSIIVVLLPDTGERYLTKLNKDWFAQHHFNFPE